MTQPWRSLAVAAVLSVICGVGTAAAQTVLARGVPAGEQVEVMLNGKPVGSAAADAAGDAKVSFKMRDSLAKTEIDANVFVDKCETTHRVWIVEVGTPAPCRRHVQPASDLRAVLGAAGQHDRHQRRHRVGPDAVAVQGVLHAAGPRRGAGPPARRRVNSQPG